MERCKYRQFQYCFVASLQHNIVVGDHVMGFQHLQGRHLTCLLHSASFKTPRPKQHGSHIFLYISKPTSPHSSCTPEHPNKPLNEFYCRTKRAIEWVKKQAPISAHSLSSATIIPGCVQKRLSGCCIRLSGLNIYSLSTKTIRFQVRC